MKLCIGDVRKIVREEYLRGVPEFLIREASSKFVGEIRNHIKKHILMTKKSVAQQREAIDAADDVLKELEISVNDLVEEKIWQFIQNT